MNEWCKHYRYDDAMIAQYTNIAAVFESITGGEFLASIPLQIEEKG